MRKPQAKNVYVKFWVPMCWNVQKTTLFKSIVLAFMWGPTSQKHGRNVKRKWKNFACKQTCAKSVLLVRAFKASKEQKDFRKEINKIPCGHVPEMEQQKSGRSRDGDQYHNVKCAELHRKISKLKWAATEILGLPQGETLPGKVQCAKRINEQWTQKCG